LSQHLLQRLQIRERLIAAGTGLLESFEAHGVERMRSVLVHDFEDSLERQGLAVGALGGQGIEDIGDDQNSRLEWRDACF